MYAPNLPRWVAPFCCAMPFCALLALSVAATFGGSVSTAALICLTALCGRITGWVLNGPTRDAMATRIENGK